MTEQVNFFMVISIPIAESHIASGELPPEHITRYMSVDMINRWMHSLDLNGVSEFDDGKGLYDSYFADYFPMYDDEPEALAPVRFMFVLNGREYIVMDVWLTEKSMEVNGVATTWIAIDGIIESYPLYTTTHNYFEDSICIGINVRPDGTFQKSYPLSLAEELSGQFYDVLKITSQ